MATTESFSSSNFKFYKIVNSDEHGMFIGESVPEGTEGAIKVKNPKSTKEKWYRAHKALIGRIERVEIREGEWEGKKFKTLSIQFAEDEGGKAAKLDVGVQTKAAQDLMEKLPAVNFKEDVRIRPFSFKPDGEDKNVTGVEIMYRSTISGNFDSTARPIVSAFHERVVGDDGVGRKQIKVGTGYPILEKPYSETSEEEWEIYKIRRQKFLEDSTRALGIKLENDDYADVPLADAFKETYVKKAEEESINPEDIPF